MVVTLVARNENMVMVTHMVGSGASQFCFVLMHLAGMLLSVVLRKHLNIPVTLSC
jgi:hypothetical protein